MSHLLAEKRISLLELARRENISPSTTWRWWRRGISGVRLEVFKLGSKPYTTQEAFERFIDASTAAAEGGVPGARTNRQRDAAAAAAERELSAAGV